MAPASSVDAHPAQYRRFTRCPQRDEPQASTPGSCGGQYRTACNSPYCRDKLISELQGDCDVAPVGSHRSGRTGRRG